MFGIRVLIFIFNRNFIFGKLNIMDDHPKNHYFDLERNFVNFAV